MKEIHYNKSEVPKINDYRKLVESILSQLDTNSKDYAKKEKEILHLGKFLLFLDSEIKGLKVSEQPDFVLVYNGKSIGLEHEIFVNQESKKREESINDLFSYVENELRNKYPNEKFLANIYINPYFNFKKAEKPRIVNQLASIMEEFVFNKNLVENECIDNISVQPHSQINLCPNLGAWWQKNLDINLLEKAIRKKEKKLNLYKTNSNVEQHWLLIVIGSVGDSSYIIDNIETFDRQVKSDFDKVYLLEDFYNNLYEIK